MPLNTSYFLPLLLLLALAGIAWILVYVAARLLPGVGRQLEPPAPALATPP